MPDIHPASVVEPGSELADSVTVGPFCHLGPQVRIGPGTRLISHVTILGRTTLGAENTVWPYAALGGDPQDLKFEGEDSELVIGDHNDIREYVTIHKGTANDAGITRVGDHNLLMAHVHVGHDSVLCDHIVIANAVQLAGHVLVEDYASVGGASAIHHFVTIGSHAYIAGMTRVVQDVPPFMLVEGVPARIRGVNLVGLKRRGFDEQAENRCKDAWRRLFRNAHQNNGVGATAEALARLEADYPNDPCILALIVSLRHSAAGIYGRYREANRHDNRYANPVR